MSSLDFPRATIPQTHLDRARAVLSQEARALDALSLSLNDSFADAVRLIFECRGCVIVTGMGKAGLIGKKLAATFSSTGTPAHFLHPAEAVHGDVGCVQANDVVVALSNSGETDEICRLIPLLGAMHVPMIAVTATSQSTLGKGAIVTMALGKLQEADEHGLAPTTSTTAMLAIGDALAIVVSEAKQFTPEQFASFHPGGSLGRRLSSVGDVMRTGDQIRIAQETATVREAYVNLGTPRRRTGALMVINSDEQLTGLFTDSDLARLLEQRRDDRLDRPIREVMTVDPLTVTAETRLGEIVSMLSHHKISELPVVDESGRPVGLIDITDIVGGELDDPPADSSLGRVIASNETTQSPNFPIQSDPKRRKSA